MKYMKQVHKEMLKREHGCRDSGDDVTVISIFCEEVLLTGKWRIEVRGGHTTLYVEVANVARVKTKTPWSFFITKYQDVMKTEWVRDEHLSYFTRYPIQECQS